MQVVDSPHLIRKETQKLHFQGKKIGFVPTMGALHSGHLSLIKRSLNENEVTVVSIFVNPLQFNNQEDYLLYPRVLSEDLEFLKGCGVDIVYAPSEEEMYPYRPKTQIIFGEMVQVMEGKFRPGHFDGVALVVNKLFNQVNPDRAYFGLKDLQQYLLIRRMVEDFSIPVDVVGLPIIREESGLALSSRNRRLSEEGKKVAQHIYKGLRLISDKMGAGEQVETLLSNVNEYYQRIEGLEIEYLEAVNAEDLSPVKGSVDNVAELAVCVAGYVEGVRLIDNLYLRQD